MLTVRSQAPKARPQRSDEHIRDSIQWNAAVGDLVRVVDRARGSQIAFLKTNFAANRFGAVLSRYCPMVASVGASGTSVDSGRAADGGCGMRPGRCANSERSSSMRSRSRARFSALRLPSVARVKPSAGPPTPTAPLTTGSAPR